MEEQDRNRRNRSGRGRTGRLTEGWLIERRGLGDLDEHERRYLQIGTGQWCGAAYATLFPYRSAAVTYALEFGFEVGRTARVVRYRRPPSEAL